MNGKIDLIGETDIPVQSGENDNKSESAEEDEKIIG